MRRRAEALTKALTEHPRPSTTALGASSTTAEFAASWLNTVAALRVRPSSLGKYVDRVERITAWLGDVRIGSLRAEQVATWQSQLLTSLSPKTVADTRATFRSIVAEAVNPGLIAKASVGGAGPRRTSPGRWRRYRLPGERVRRRHRDDARATKTEGANGRHLLTPVVVELLRRRRQAQSEERQRAGETWHEIIHEGRPIDLILTTTTGGLVLRQAVTKAVAAVAVAAGVDPTGLGTHAGRSTAITVLYAEEGLELAEIARHVVTPRRRQRPATFATSVGGQARPPKRRVGYSTLRASNVTGPLPTADP